MSDKAPTKAELMKATGLGEEVVKWVMEQLGIAGESAGTPTRQNPSPVAYIATKGKLSGVTVAGQYLVYATTTGVVYIPMNEAVIEFKAGDTLSATLNGKTIEVTLKPDAAVGVTLERLHKWIRNMVIDYRRT